MGRKNAFQGRIEVPCSQIEYFYRKLHRLLDNTLDREQEQNIKVESFRSLVSNLLLESNDMTSMLLKRAVSRLESGEDAYDIAVEYIESNPEFEDEDPSDLANKIQMMSAVIIFMKAIVLLLK